jgi:thiol-disulfide isomerase/thioredoxin
MSRSFLLPFFFLLIACVTQRPAVVPPTSPPPVVEKKSDTVAVPEKKPATPAEELLLRDPVTGAIAPLAELAGGQPVLLDFSASWCEPCATLIERLNGIQPRFAGKIRFFMVIQKGDAPERVPGRPDYPLYILERAPAGLQVTPPQVLPTVILFGADGTVAAELAGLYPGLYYYGLIADVVGGS